MELIALLSPTLRAVSEPIDRIIAAFSNIVFAIFTGGNGYLKLLVDTIMGNSYLLISVSLILIGFVIGIIKRIISV